MTARWPFFFQQIADSSLLFGILVMVYFRNFLSLHRCIELWKDESFYQIWSKSHFMKLNVKPIISVMGSATILACFGLKAAFDSHSLAMDKDNKPAPIPHTYSLHSWCGMFTISLAVAQV